MWVADGERYEYVRSAAGVLVGVPTGAAALAGVAYVVLQQFAGSAPVGAAAVVAGVAVAALGATVLPGDSLTPGALNVAAKRATVGAAVVAVVAAADLGGTVVETEGVEIPGVPELEPGLVDPLLAPGVGPVPPVGTFLLVVGLGAASVRAALGRLPVRELLDDRSDDPGAALARYERLRRGLGYGWIAAAIGLPLVLVNQLSAAPALWGRLPTAALALVDALARSSFLRSLAVAAIVASVAAVLLAWGVRRAARTDPSAHAGSVGALAGGGLATVAATATAEPVVGTLLRAVERALPASAATEFARQGDAVVAYYGDAGLALALATLGAVSTLGACLVLRVAMTASVLPRAGNGHALASAGLVFAGAFGLTVGVGPTVGLGAVVAAVVVSDTGRYGRGIGRGVGRRARSLTAQVVHTGGVLGVSVVAGVAGVAALAVAGSVSVPAGPTATLALVAGVGSVSVLALALALGR